MLIYDALKKDHEAVKSLIQELLTLEENDTHHELLVEQIRDELIPHSRAEEAVFYNALRSVDADRGKVLHGFKEHLQAEALLRTLQVEVKTHAPWKDTAKKLQEELEHHIQEEETTIFALAREMLTEQEADQIGDAFEQLKPKIKEQGFLATTMELVANLLPPRLMKKFQGQGPQPKSA